MQSPEWKLIEWDAFAKMFYKFFQMRVHGTFADELDNALACLYDELAKKSQHKWEETGVPGCQLPNGDFTATAYGCVKCGMILAEGVKPADVKCPCVLDADEKPAKGLKEDLSDVFVFNEEG